MTKTINKVMSVIVAVAVVMMLGMSSLAATNYTISITRPANDKASHTYKAYQIFTGDLYNDGTSTTLINLQAGSNLDLAGLKTQLGLAPTATVADVVNELNNISEAEAAKKIQASVKETPALLQAVSGTDLTTTISNVPGPGYYLVTDTIDRTSTEPDGLQGAVSSFMLQILGENTAVTVNAKTDVPTMDKVIDEGTGVTANTASLGDSVPFKITSKVPDTSKYNRYWFKVSDVLCKGLTFNNDLAITVGSKTLVKDTDYTLTTSTDTSTGKTTIGIVFKDFKQYTKDSDITITYSATLNDDADRTKTGNDNVAKLIFSNDPNHTYTGDNPNDDTVTGETPDKRTVTYTTGIAVQKVDENGHPLPGATFKITGTKLDRVATFATTFTVDNTSGTYYKLKDGTYTTTPADSTTESLYESTTVKYKKTEGTTFAEASNSGTTMTLEKTTDSTGYVSFEGLAAGTYTITEEAAPSGYKKSDKVYELVIDSTPTLTSPGWTISYGNGASAGLTIDTNNVNTDGPILYTFEVENVKGHDLPVTGGIGTTVYYTGGSVLLLAGVTLLIAKKRNAKTEEKSAS